MAMTKSTIRIGISSCLLGEPVRFDGNHKHDRYITDTLGAIFEFVPVCPEVGIGLGTPRPAIQLVGSPEAPRALGVKVADLDVTDKLVRYGQCMAGKLTDISGYIFKSNSPSCGMTRVKLYDGHRTSKQGVGIYAREIMRAHPLLQVVEEDRLGDPLLRDHFIECVFAYHRWQQLTGQTHLDPDALELEPRGYY